jgi:serine/threonine-protein kinase
MIDTTHATVTSELSGPLDFDLAQRLATALLDPESAVDAETTDPGLPIIGDYLIDREIGRGGGGTVYHAVLPGWNDEFAIKVLHLPVGDRRATKRAWRELDIVEELDLPDSPRVYEYGLHDGRVFIVSEHVNGVPLDEYCRTQRLDRRQKVELMLKVARRVHALHERGVIHRDLKPSNVLVNAGGDPVIIDLGIATLVSEDLTETLTAGGAPIGSVAFMAPEQARGVREGTIRGDVYGLGATACVILTGNTPHDLEAASVVEGLERVGHEAARDPRALDPELPTPLALILRRALAPEEGLRYESAAGLADDFQRWLDGLPVEPKTQPPSWWRNRLLSIRRRPGTWALGSVACVGVCASVVMTGVSAVNAAEADAERHWHDAYLEAIAEGSARYSAALHDERFRDALHLLTILDGQFKGGADNLPASDEMIATLEGNRGAFTRNVLQAIHGEPETPARSVDLAMSALRSIYGNQDRWDPATAAAMETVLWELGLGHGE